LFFKLSFLYIFKLFWYFISQLNFFKKIIIFLYFKIKNILKNNSYRYNTDLPVLHSYCNLPTYITTPGPSFCTFCAQFWRCYSMVTRGVSEKVLKKNYTIAA
jgi:hypothetical protein